MIRSKKYIVLSGIGLIILVLLIFLNKSWSKEESKEAINYKNNTDTKENITTENSVDMKIQTNNKILQEENTSDITAIVTQSIINEDVETEIYKLVEKYYTKDIDKDILAIEEQSETDPTLESIMKKRELIDEYKNFNTYVKPGMDNNTYVVFSTYEIKLKNIDTLVPGMSVLSVIKDDKGALLIDSDSNDDKLKDYIRKLTKEDDIKNIIEGVNTNLINAIEKDKSLKELIDYIKDIIG